MFKKCWIFVVMLCFGCLLLNSRLKAEELIMPDRYLGNEIEDSLRNLEIGEEFSYRNLTIVPIYAKRIRDLNDYLSLDEAQKRGYLRITEVNGGNVPQLKVRNKSNSYVFLMSGEILKGGKQNRLIANDVLLGPKIKDIIIPVYCCEQGRWQKTSKDFSGFDMVAQPHLRNKLLSKYSQSEVWEDIKEEQARFSVSSSTSSLQDVYQDKKVQRQMNEYIVNIERIPRLEKDVVGVAAVTGDRIVGIDIFSNPDLFSSLWPKLLKSYVASALYYGENNTQSSREEIKQLLNEILEVKHYRRKAIGLGEEMEMTVDDYTGFGLVYNDNVIHLSLFPPEEKEYRTRNRIPVLD